MLVVDGAGVPVATSDAAPRELSGARGRSPGTDPAVDRALASSVEGTLSANGWVSAYRNLSSYQSLRGVRWAILHQQPEAEAYALARRTTRDTAIIGGAALALALALGAFFATRLTRPLADLARRADAIAAGAHRRRRRRSTGPGEIGVLGHADRRDGARIAERAELQAALARGDRLASVGVMSAQVAHEINNPLTTVLGYAKLLLEDKPEGHPDRAALELIAERGRADEDDRRRPARVRAHAAPERATRRSAAGDAARRELRARGGDRATSARCSARSCAKARATLAIDVAAGAPVAIDAHALQQVLVNLVQNARRR